MKKWPASRIASIERCWRNVSQKSAKKTILLCFTKCISVGMRFRLFKHSFGGCINAGPLNDEYAAKSRICNITDLSFCPLVEEVLMSQRLVLFLTLAFYAMPHVIHVKNNASSAFPSLSHFAETAKTISSA